MLRPAPRNVHAQEAPEGLRSVIDALRHIVRELRLSAREAERGAGISGAQLFVLQALAQASVASLNELANRTSTDQSSVSVVVKRLVSRSLVTRRPSRLDARRVELALTAAGRKLVARCPEPTQVKLVSVLRRLAPRELEGLKLGLAALVREMGPGETATVFLEKDVPSQQGPEWASESTSARPQERASRTARRRSG